MGNVTSGEYPYAFGPNPERRLGRSIKLMRGHRGMSQADLASSLNQLGKTRFTQSMIAKTEAGDRPIRLNEALDFAFVLGEELELLLLLEDDEQMLAELGEIQERLDHARQEHEHAVGRLERAEAEYAEQIALLRQVRGDGDGEHRETT